MFTNKIDLDIIADEIIRVRKEGAKEHNELNILVARQREAQKALDNIIKAAEAGFLQRQPETEPKNSKTRYDSFALQRILG